MAASVQTTRFSGLLSVALLPLTWVERSRGRARILRCAILGLIVILASVLAWRQASLAGLPDPGEPFDETAFGTVKLADTDNAMTFYRPAIARYKTPASREVRAKANLWVVTDWSTAAPEVRDSVRDNQEALDLWLRGTKCPDSLLIQPRDLGFGSSENPGPMLREFARMALREGSRREQAGDLEGAWAYYRGVLRSSRHIEMHGLSIQRFLGRLILSDAAPHVGSWAGRPEVSAPLLRKAIDDVNDCLAMTPPASDTIRCEYFFARAILEHPERWDEWGLGDLEHSKDWYNHLPAVVPARRFLRREPERSIRGLRYLVGGALAQCDRPEASRARLGFPGSLIYEHDSSTPTAIRAAAPDTLYAWWNTSVIRASLFSLGDPSALYDAERFDLERMRLTLSLSCYRREHGRPPKTYQALVGPYLPSLPEGFQPGDRPGPIAP